MERRLLVTGAGGFLGRHITDHFALSGWQVLALDRTAKGVDGERVRWVVRDLGGEEIEDLVKGFAPSACAHCAGRSSVEASVQDPLGDFVLGPMVVARLLDALRVSSPECRFVQLSSAAVYGNPEVIPTGEQTAPAPISPYGWHKWQSEMLGQEYSALYSLPTAAVRIFSAYGEGLQRQVVWDVCRKLMGPEPPQFFGSGTESRDFIHARDVARGVEAVLLRGEMRGEVYNLASGIETTIREVINLAQAILGTERRPVFLGSLPPGVPSRWCADIGKIARLGFAPMISMRAGLEGVAEEARAWRNTTHGTD